MEKFKATKVNENGIELRNSEDLERLYKIVEREDNFILEWQEGSVKHSKVIIGTQIASKIKTGDTELTSKEGGNEK